MSKTIEIVQSTNHQDEVMVLVNPQIEVPNFNDEISEKEFQSESTCYDNRCCCIE